MEVEVTTPHFVIKDPSFARPSCFATTGTEKKPSYNNQPAVVFTSVWGSVSSWIGYLFNISALGRSPLRLSYPPRLILHDEKIPIVPTGTTESLWGTFMRQRPGLSSFRPHERVQQEHANDMVTWSTLLADIHALQFSTRLSAYVPFLTYADMVNMIEGPSSDTSADRVSMICFHRTVRSWDLMPPDVVRPVASTTIGCLVTMIHRLGMNWFVFDPDEGKIRASREGRNLSASLIRGLGLVVEYSSHGTNFPDMSSISIPCQEADAVSYYPPTMLLSLKADCT